MSIRIAPYSSILESLAQTLPGARARSRSRTELRQYHDFIRGPTDTGTYKVSLSSPKVVGVAASRGYREYQEDATAIHALQLLPSEIKQSHSHLKTPFEWDSYGAGSPFLAGQVGYFGIFDGHGGKQVSNYLSENLHSLIESANTEDIEDIVNWTKKKHAGYFKRWKGGTLERWIGKSNGEKKELDLEGRLTLAFLKADREILETVPNAEKCGSTASVVLLHSLDSPAQPYWAASRLGVYIAHCGDTRVLLCTPSGLAKPLTDKHHAQSRLEASRLRRMGAGLLVSDSYGESRWMGVVENTRGFGDGNWKGSGVTAEPEVGFWELAAQKAAGEEFGGCYLVLVSDGITKMISDQEIIDLARRSLDPTRAAKTIVQFAEDLGANDNCTCVVIPLKGWGNVGGEDRTADRREYRRKNTEGMSNRMRRM